MFIQAALRDRGPCEESKWQPSPFAKHTDDIILCRPRRSACDHHQDENGHYAPNPPLHFCKDSSIPSLFAIVDYRREYADRMTDACMQPFRPAQCSVKNKSRYHSRLNHPLEPHAVLQNPHHLPEQLTGANAVHSQTVASKWLSAQEA